MHRSVEERTGRHQGAGFVSEAHDLGCHVLQMADEDAGLEVSDVKKRFAS